MAPKKNKPTEPTADVALLTQISNGQVTRVSQAVGKPLVDAGLIDVNLSDIVDGNALVRLTDAGTKFLANQNSAPAQASAPTSPYAIIKGAVLPPSKRGGRGAGAPTIYPFATMDVGDMFFVPKSEKHPDPVKTLGSTVSSANMKFSEKTGEVKTVTRTKRGPKNKAVLDEAGNKIKEQVEVPVYKSTRRFAIRAVTAGMQYGGFTADADGALIARVE